MQIITNVNKKIKMEKNKDELIKLCIMFTNNTYFSTSVNDNGISLIGQVTNDEMEKLVKSKLFEIEEILNKNGYKIIKK